MKKQNYLNHSRYYTAHHFIFYPVAFMLFVICVYNMWTGTELLLWSTIAFLVFMLVGLSLMMRQHYSLINQNRTVRLELRLRYYILTQKRFEEVEKKLSPKQIFALRFASDEELLDLVDRSIKENLSPTEIKRSIKNWLPDNFRV